MRAMLIEQESFLVGFLAGFIVAAILAGSWDVFGLIAPPLRDPAKRRR